MNTVESGEKLCVKALASALGVSSRYVYEMRRCGFQMEGNGHYQQVSTVEVARLWIDTQGFKILNGKGIVLPLGR